MTPRVSILMATWNRANLLGRAIASARRQSFEDWELVIVDDGSTDNTEEVVKEWLVKDKRIKYFKISHTGRIAKVSNFGLRQTTGEYFAVLDDDDYWAISDKLEKQVDFLDRNQDYVGCGGGLIVIDENNREKLRFLKPEKDGEIRNNLLSANQITNTTAMFRRSVAEKAGFYDETLSQFADWDFWLKTGLAGKLYNFPEYFAYYLMWHHCISFRKQAECARSARAIVRRYKDKYPGFNKAMTVVMAQYLHAYLLPNFIKKISGPIFSRLKKMIFSRKAK